MGAKEHVYVQFKQLAAPSIFFVGGVGEQCLDDMIREIGLLLDQT
jgi:hypothetical protein